MPGLDWLKEMMDNVDEEFLVEYFGKIRPNERVLSDKKVDPETRKLFAVNLQLRNQITRKMIELEELLCEADQDEKKRSRLTNEIVLIYQKGSLIEKLFWVTLRMEFNCCDVDTFIGIREDWVVVTYNHEIRKENEQNIFGHISVPWPGTPEYGN